eukprot:5210964-Pyramimonas_sp.AAC.1
MPDPSTLIRNSMRAAPAKAALVGDMLGLRLVHALLDIGDGDPQSVRLPPCPNERCNMIGYTNSYANVQVTKHTTKCYLLLWIVLLDPFVFDLSIEKPHPHRLVDRF